MARDTNVREELVPPTPDPKKTSSTFLQVPSASKPTKNQKDENTKPKTWQGQGGRWEKILSILVPTSCTHKPGVLQKLGQVGCGALGEEIEEFLRPEKRGKHVTELHESFIRL